MKRKGNCDLIETYKSVVFALLMIIAVLVVLLCISNANFGKPKMWGPAIELTGEKK